MRRLRLDWTFLFLIFAAVGLTAATWIIPGWARFVSQLAMSSALAGIGVMLLLRASLLSFGQSLYYFTGAYAVALFSRHFGIVDTIAGIVIAIISAAALAAIIGLFVARYRGIFFSMLTLALSMVGYGAAVKLSFFGGSDGLNVPAGSFFGFQPRGESLQMATFILCVWVSAMVAAATHFFLRSRIGKMVDAIGNNELRLEYLGLSVRHAVHLIYALAAAAAGAGGAIAAISARHVDPGFAYWTTAGEFVFIVLLGGQTTVVAPFIGAVLLEFVRSLAGAWFPNQWQLVLGSVMLLIVLFLPKGLTHLFVVGRTWLRAGLMEALPVGSNSRSKSGAK